MPTVATSTNIENIQMHQQSGAPSTPAANYFRLYLKSDGLYYITSAGTEVKVASAAAFTAQTANTFLAGPTSAGPTVPTFRAIVSADLTTALTTPPAIGGTTPATGAFTTLAGTAITASSSLTVSRSSGDANVSVDSIAGTARQFVFLTAASARWTLQCNSSAESGSNAGSNFTMTRFSDAGSGLDSPFVILRSTGQVFLGPDSALTNSVQDQVIIRHNTSGTPAAGLGSGVRVELETSTTTNTQAGRIRWHWTVVTHASRTARGTLSANDSGGERDCIMWEGSGTAAMVGFYGTAPIAKPAPTGSRGGNAALASLLTALANLGLITDSTSA